VEIGELVAGKYRVERVLGRGGQGEVVQATNLMLGQSVAMKVLLPAMAADQVLVQRFLREARAAVQLKSEHVARVLDVGTLDSAAPYIVFEYLDGADLNGYPRDGLTVGTIVDFALQAAEALAEAHAKGIIHRDIKPANLFVTRTVDGTPCVKVLDFGISKIVDGTAMGLTQSYTMMGTPSYSSPEQLMSTKDADYRTDIWSLGVVLYELLEGRLPYEADTLTQLAMKVMTSPLPPITARLQPPLIAAIERCLEKDPARRFQTMGELSMALAPFASSTEQATMLARRASRISSPAIGETVRAPFAPPVPPRRRWLGPVGLGLATGAGIVAAILITRSTPNVTSSSPAATTVERDAAPEVHEMVTAPQDAAITLSDAQVIVATPPGGGEVVVAPRDAPEVIATDAGAPEIAAGVDATNGNTTTTTSSTAMKTGATKTGATKTGATKTGATKTGATKTGATKTGATKTGGTKTGTTGTSGIVDRDGDGIPDVR
jgi:eukaryotic-like serine/threonine-protein kinase